MGTMPEKYDQARGMWTERDSWAYDIHAAIDDLNHLRPPTPETADEVQEIKNKLLNLLRFYDTR